MDNPCTFVANVLDNDIEYPGEYMKPLIPPAMG